ncbi:MAG: tetratricopeptide repeat protein [Bacteroidia bacterium]
MGFVFFRYRSALVFLYSFFLLSTHLCRAQNKTVDSVLTVFKPQKEDTGKVNRLIRVSQKYLNEFKLEEALALIQNAIKIAEKIKFDNGRAYAFVIKGYCYDAESKYDSAIVCYQSALDIYSLSGENKYTGKIKTAVANAYYFKGNINKALENYILSLKHSETIQDSSGIAGSWMGIGNCYFDLKKLDLALDNYRRAYDVYDRLNNKAMLSWLLSNIADVYKAENKPDEALASFFKALEMKKKAGENDFSLSTTYLGICGIYLQKEDFKSALRYASLTLEIRKKTNDIHELAVAYEYMANAYEGMKDFNEAGKMYREAVSLAEKTNSLDVLEDSYRGLAEDLYLAGNLKEAYDYRILYETIKDSILNKESTKQFHQLTTLYETEKKEQQIKLLNKDKEFKEAEITKQKFIIGGVVIGLCLMVALALVVLRSLQINKKKNRIIQMQKETVEKQKEIVEEKQKEILDSINYASRIQRALLPSSKYIENHLKRPGGK